jgi:hypothetical protein
MSRPKPKILLEYINKNRIGYGGTSPHVLVDMIKINNFHGTLILVSDGQIGSSEVRLCSEELKDWKFKEVFIYLISTGYSQIAESVSCAFTRNSPHSIKIYDSNILDEKRSLTISVEDFKLVEEIENIKSVSEFVSKIDTLNNVLTSINMGTKGNSKIHTKLVNLKNKLIKEESNKSGDILSVSEFTEKPCLETLSKVWDEYYGSKSNWAKDIDRYISWCSGSLETVFDRSNRENRSEVTSEPTPESVKILDEPVEQSEDSRRKYSIQCPISLEDSSNLIILLRKKDKSVLNDLDVNIRDSLINCPLNALRNETVITYLKNIVDNVISIETYKELVEHGISDKSPLTREDIIGGICLGCDMSHVNATNASIRHSLTSGKSLGNADIWYAVIYLLVERGVINHLSECLPMMRDHMIYRMKNCKSFMSMSGLPTYPTYKVSLGLALYASVCATACDSSFIQNPKNEKEIKLSDS